MSDWPEPNLFTGEVFGGQKYGLGQLVVVPGDSIGKVKSVVAEASEPDEHGHRDWCYRYRVELNNGECITVDQDKLR